ncbi:MAG TPA: hypothetical protein VFG47_22380 [Geminicoccaceae bacterium]|nr:hypothetical protein [Geminicoccaceae bacterium]
MRRRDPQGLGFTDLLFNALLGFAVMFVLAYLLINPTAKTGAVDNKAEFLVTLSWPDGRRDDADIYVLDPDGNLVWFGRREAGLMHLDRDDLGRSNDVVVVDGREVVNPLNQEVVAIRGILPGEYVVNVHLYRMAGGGAVPVSLKVEKLNPTVSVVHYAGFELGYRGEERTAVRFTVRADGGVGGVSTLPRRLVPLRGAAPGAAS